MDAGPDSPEREAADVVPVEPDEDRLAPDMIIRDEAPVAAVVAVVAHHQIVARGYLAAETAVIVNAVLLSGERSYVERIHRLRGRVLGDRVTPPVPALYQTRRGHVREPLQIAVAAIRHLSKRHAIHRELLVLIHDLIAGQPDDALDEILRRIDRIAKDDHVATLRVAEGDDLLLDDRESDAVGELVHQDEV